MYLSSSISSLSETVSHIPNNQHFQCLCELSTKLSSLEQIPRKQTIPYYGVLI